MKGYKAFNKGLICRDKQYAENTVFEEESAEICKIGMHFCKNPLDTLDYYPLIDNKGNITEFAEVEALDDAKTNDNKKFCTKKLKIGAKLNLSQFIKASVDVTYQNIKSEVDKKSLKATAGGYNAKLAGGDNATLAGGENSIIVGDNHSIAKGKKGAVIVLIERDNNCNIIDFKAVQVDGEKIKEDVLYKLKNGEFVKVGVK
ncbi:DUF7666 domain-containing protein [Ruminococcus bromii]|uniref:DUF7666 domain-containing protein n=1 Tax=Ruminococcus bromii TaxID=40518 RepID=UPI00241C43FD|nr:hypothetical protein [Ruminococcus bromii]